MVDTKELKKMRKPIEATGFNIWMRNVTHVVSAGLSSTAGTILLGGLLLGMVFLPRRCKNYSTRERCEKEGCRWMGDRCFTR